jgi:hypothetical protein
MRGHRLPSPDVIAFRSAIVDVVTADIDRFHYIDRDVLVGVCPVCDLPLTVIFHGIAARADLICHSGCAESEIVDAIRSTVRP